MRGFPSSERIMAEIPNYDHRAIEKKWQQRWNEIGLFHAADDDPRPKYYCLMMFPYPSGDRLHVGHGRNYILGDVVVRYKLMTGWNVLSPMGWDAFGLPAENDAIKKRIAPWISVRDNIERMKVQFSAWGVGYDWRREIATCRPDYYKWTQWLFLELYKNGLAYRKKAPVNWCPDCRTVLANEQVMDDETCERCGSRVEVRELTQWFFRITKYADRLIDDLEKVGNWPERVKLLQRNWIDRSEGARIEFSLTDGTPLPVYTTRPDTVFGVTYMSVAPEHPIAKRAAAERPEVAAFIERWKALPASERTGEAAPKEGIATGFEARNPANGEVVPVFVASYCLMEYGTGAVMAVPAHDQRDFEFARKHGLPIRVVIEPRDGRGGPPWPRALDPATMKEAYVEPGVMVESGEFSGMESEAGKWKVVEWLAARGLAAREKRYRLRDWLLSRQRYWGAPIPIVYCPLCGEVADERLPVLLPHDRGVEVEVRPSGTGKSPLANVPEFVNADCPRCGGKAERETDTMDTFVDSAWYFFRFCSPREEGRIFDPAAVEAWMPVDQYIGGAEHATKHLIYARFLTKVLKDLGHVSFDEPFTNLFSQGLICRWSEKDQKLEKMSKSKGNVVNPDELIEKFGADTERLYTLFMGPPERDAEWNDEAIVGCWKFLGRLWTMVHEAAPHVAGDRAPVSPGALSAEGAELRRKTHETIAKVTRDIEGAFGFNTAIAAIMELVNKAKAIAPATANADDRRALRDALEAAVILLAPMVPHIGEELWRVLGHDVATIFREPWPKADPEAMKRAEIEIAIQVNGKVRSREKVPAGAGDDEVREVVLRNGRVRGYLDGKEVVKTIVVPGKLVNIVVK
jgi:leucyl-tRNA synthetase